VDNPKPIKVMKFLLLIFTGLLSMSTLAQQANVASGGNATGTGGSFSYSVGQVFYSSDTEGTINEGVQQPYEIYIVSIEESLVELELNLYPNPTLQELSIEIPNFKSDLTATIYNSGGLLMENVKLISSRTLVSVRNWPASTYYIHVGDASGNSSKYKLIKN